MNLLEAIVGYDDLDYADTPEAKMEILQFREVEQSINFAKIIAEIPPGNREIFRRNLPMSRHKYNELIKTANKVIRLVDEGWGEQDAIRLVAKTVFVKL